MLFFCIISIRNVLLPIKWQVFPFIRVYIIANRNLNPALKWVFRMPFLELKDVLFFLAIPFIVLFATRLLLWITELNAIINLIILLSIILVTIFYVFVRSKSKFELSNKHAVIVSFVYFFTTLNWRPNKVNTNPFWGRGPEPSDDTLTRNNS